MGDFLTDLDADEGATTTVEVPTTPKTTKKRARPSRKGTRSKQQPTARLRESARKRRKTDADSEAQPAVVSVGLPEPTDISTRIETEAIPPVSLDLTAKITQAKVPEGTTKSKPKSKPKPKTKARTRTKAKSKTNETGKEKRKRKKTKEVQRTSRSPKGSTSAGSVPGIAAVVGHANKQLVGLDPKQPKVPRASETVMALRDAVRTLVPSDTARRIQSVHNVSYLSVDPTREEEKSTLASMASEGVSLDSDVVIQSPTEDQEPPRKKRKRRGSARPELVHRLDQVPRPETLESRVPTEAEAEAGHLPLARETGKHPGEIKTAAPGVAIPVPGDRASGLRKKLDASCLSRSGDTQIATADTTTTTTTTTTTSSSSSCIADETVWETESSTQVAGQLDHRRLSPASVDNGGSVRPLSELVTMFSDQERLGDSDARGQLLRHMSGLVERQLLEVDYAAKRVREGTEDSDESAEPDASVAAAAAASVFVRNTKKDATKTLVLDADEQEILDVMCNSSSSSGSSQADSTAASPISNKEKQASLQAAMPNVGLGLYLDTPLDEAEVAVAIGASLPEALVYFMSFDDSVRAMERVYQSVVRLASLPNRMEILRSVRRPHDLTDRDHVAMVQRLRDYETELGQKWNQVDKSESESEQNHKLWVQLSSVRVLLAVMTGQLDGQRLNTVRTLVAMEENLMNGLYREPVMRCFSKSAASEDPSGMGWSDHDILRAIQSSLLQQDSASETSSTSTAKRSEAPLSSINSPTNPSGGLVLPDLGEPATKAYCADFLRAPDPSRSLERPCVRGERACMAWILSAHTAWPATGGLNRASHAFVMREFYPPDRWQRIQQDRTLPKQRGMCLLCSRFMAKFYSIQLRLLGTRAVTNLQGTSPSQQRWRGCLLGQNHSNAIEPEHGYTQADLLPIWKPTNGPWTGIVQPMVAFRANSYISGECVPPIDLSKPQQKLETALATTTPDTNGESSSTSSRPRTVPCFYERTSADFP